MTTLTEKQRFMLEWLAKEDASTFGECHGATLDGLVLRGLARIAGTGGRAAVSITEAGARAIEGDREPRGAYPFPSFDDLTPRQQEGARETFADARAGDGFGYIVAQSGRVVDRRPLP